MDYNKIINEGSLIYASRNEDTKFREWRVSRTMCSVEFFRILELTKLDLVVLLTLDFNGGSLYGNELAEILGFNVEDNFNVSPKRYYDPGEKGIFEGVLKELVAYGLILQNENIVQLTNLGQLSLKRNEKYSFHTGVLPLVESFDINPKQTEEYLYFPFREALGIVSNVQSVKNVAYSKFFDISNLEELMFESTAKLVGRIEQQVTKDVRVFEAEESSESRMGQLYLDFRLYEYNGIKYPIVFYNEQISSKTNDILYNGSNKEYIKEKIHLGEYLFLVRESKLHLDYNTLWPYSDVWNLDDFLKNDNLVWNDDLLFAKIAERANGAQWNVISEYCPIEILKHHLSTYKDSFDWIVLSKRYDDDFIICTAVEYPWDFESLSIERNTNFVKRLIVIEELHKDEKIEWDWEIILEKLDDGFIIEHINTVPFDMFSVTNKYLSNYPDIITEHPERKWDWKTISEIADLGYILNNIVKFACYIELEIVMPRAYSNGDWADKYCNSSEFTFAAVENKEWLQEHYNANEANYIWSYSLIDWHEKLGFVNWKSQSKAKGLECNEHIIWNGEMLQRYKNKEFSLKGLNHISHYVTDCNVINDNPDFKWSWQILSARDIVTSDFTFVKEHISQLSLSAILPKITSKQVSELFSIDTFKKLCSEQNVWDKVTKYVEKSTIISNLHFPNWDWKVITENFCATMNFSALGQRNLLDKLDWEYISEHSSIEKIKSSLSIYVDKWNWNSLTQRLDHNFIISNLQEYYKFWNWEYILQTVLSDEDLLDSSINRVISIILSEFDEDKSNQLWTLFTSRFSTENVLYATDINALDGINFKWNYKDIYNRSDFDITTYLSKYVEDNIYVDWDALSSSKALNRILKKNTKSNQEFKNWQGFVRALLENEKYKWNFVYLSTLQSINWCDTFLRIRTSEWDWTYLSEHSGCFNSRNPKDLSRHIKTFSQYLDFSILSKRKDINMPLQVLEDLVNFNWNWHDISSNRSYDLSFDFVTLHTNFDWDWYALSERKDCVFTCDFISEHRDFNWNWQFLSKRKEIKINRDFISSLVDKEWNWRELQKRFDIVFDEELLDQIVNKDIDWYTFSKRDDFYPTLHTLKLLQNKGIDWTGVSKRMELDYNVILLYKDKLDWSILTKSTHIDLSNEKTLQTFCDYLDWKYISYSMKFVLSFDNLQQFKNKIDWSIICKRPDFIPDELILSTFEDYVDWQRVSQISTIEFTQSLVDQFKDKWDWVALSSNPSFVSSNIENVYNSELNLMRFYNNLKMHNSGNPYVYHFTHMFNAIEVMKSHKILSRNRAKELGLLKYDSAGSVVNRSAKAHPYARFYYRTGTPTQFYNECLGKQYNSKYYHKALGNGLPMCPMPVFFKFNLQEVLSKHSGSCFYSTGNLQATWARIFKVEDDPANIDTINLFSSRNYDKVVREKKQQEFLVKSEFDFSDINDYQIICYDREETDILKSIFINDPISEHIYSIYDSEDVFEHENPPLNFSVTESAVEIGTRYSGKYMFQIESEKVNKVQIINKDKIKAIKKNIIQLRESVNVEKGDIPFDIYYVNTDPSARSPRWLVYQYAPEDKESVLTETDTMEDFLGISFEDNIFSPDDLITSIELTLPKLEELYNKKVRHYVIKDHILLVCKQFEKYAFKFNTDYMSIDLMRVILAMHDIGKAIDRFTQHEHTLALIKEFWEFSPFHDYEFKIVESLLKNDNLGRYFQQKYELENLKNEILADANELNIKPDVLLQYKMILYQCDIASYTEDAGGLKFLEFMFEYDECEKKFNEKDGLLQMSEDYMDRYYKLKEVVNE